MIGETLLRILEPAEARATLLARKPVGDVDVTPTLAAGIERVFGERLTPDEVVRRLLADVRRRGDAALRDWTQRIDGVALGDLAVPSQALADAYQALAPDLRHAMVFDDVKQVEIDSLKVDGVKSAAATLRFVEVDGAVIRRSTAPQAADPFLRLEGDRTREIVLEENDVAQAARTVELGSGVSKEAVSSD